MLNYPLRRVFLCVKLSLRHSVEKLRIIPSPHLKRKKVKTATKDSPQSELQPSTRRSRILESIHLSHLRLDESKWKENAKIRTSAKRLPTSRGQAADLVVLLFAQGSLSFVFFERPG